MIQPKYGNTGQDQDASRSRRVTTPKFTALRETIANAIVMEADGSVVLGWSGPHSSTASAVTASANPVIAQRKICGGLTILVPGLREGRCITLGSGTSTKEGDAFIDVEDRRIENQLPGGGQDRELRPSLPPDSI